MEAEESSKYWICRIDEKYLGNISKNKILGAKSPRAKTIRSVKSSDKILFFMPLLVGKTRLLSFIGYGLVENSFDDDNSLLGFDKSKRKIKLKGIKYFTQPLPAKNVASDLKFIKNKKNSSGYFKSEFREISEEDFNFIIKRMNSSKTFPGYFEKMSFTMDEFLTNSIKGLYELIKNTEKSNQIEIKRFIKLLHKLVNSYGISKSYEDIEEYYAENIWKLGFEHSPSRNPDNLVKLYGPRGNSHRFGYIKLG